MAAPIQGEIRVGPNHQARLPSHVPNKPMEEKTPETLTWSPDQVADSDLIMFLRAVRSMAASAGMCDGSSSEVGFFLAASRDQTTTTAMDALHKCRYDTEGALHDLVKQPIGQTIEKMWTEDDIKKFVRGLKQHGKNFFRIRRDLLAHKETSDLVEFYYLWKRSAAASSHRARPRLRRAQMLRRGKTNNTRAARATPSEIGSSTSDSDSACDDSDDNSNLSGPCHHCEVAVAKAWHRVDKDGTVLCTNCKLHFDEARSDVKTQDLVDFKAQEFLKDAENEILCKKIKSDDSALDKFLTPPPILLNTPTFTASAETPSVKATDLVPVDNSALRLSNEQNGSESACVSESAQVEPVEKDDDSDVDETTGQNDFVTLLSVPGGKGPDPKIDDTECHRSKHATFRRHWNRGDNSCARTDLVFFPIPTSSTSSSSSSSHSRCDANGTKDKSPVSSVADSRRDAPSAPGLDAMPALQRLRDYASAATTNPLEQMDHRFRASPPVSQQANVHYGGLVQRPPLPGHLPYDLLQPQFAPFATEPWLALEQQRQWERLVAMNPSGSDIARMQMNAAMANSMHLTHTHAHTHLHFHAATAARAAAAMHQHPMLGYHQSAAAAAAAAGWAARPGLDVFNASFLYGPPPALPPAGFMAPHPMLDMTQQQMRL